MGTTQKVEAEKLFGAWGETEGSCREGQEGWSTWSIQDAVPILGAFGVLLEIDLEIGEMFSQ